jgi:SAM-dependent methyltransferase
MTTMTSAGSAERWGPLWGSRPQDWAANEEQQTPTYAEAIRRVALSAWQSVLDVGCGSGVFLRLAADRGATVCGVDASAELVEIAQARVPEADVRVGDMQFLPFENDRFDLVTGFNAFFFAADIVAALREARRVAKPDAQVVIQVWGAPEHCDLDAMKRAVAPFLPAPSGDRPPRDLWQPGVLEGIAAEAGLSPQSTFTTSWAYSYPDEQSLVRGMMAAGGLAAAAEAAGEDDVRTAILESLAPYRTPSGGYRLANEFHFLVARA